MASLFSRVFTALGSNPYSIAKRHLPMINAIVQAYSNNLWDTTQIGKKKTLMSWYKGIPELTALINKVARDIVGKFHFEPAIGSGSGRNKIIKANTFAQKVMFRKQLFSKAVDILVTGEAFGWIGKLKDEDVAKEVAKITRRYFKGKEAKEIARNIFLEIKAEESISTISRIDEDMLKPRKYRTVPSSTVEIIYDQYDVKGYRQIIETNAEEFTPDEIIHYTLMDVDGKINGFTPVESILTQLSLLREMWQNQLSLHKNGGQPDKLFILKDIQPNSPAYKRIEEQLEGFKLAENKHGNMLFTGNVDVKELQQLDNMQFKDLGLYVTGLIAMQWQVPRSSIPYIIGGTNTKDDTGGNSERGYRDNIKFAQELLADIMNTQFWIPYFGVKIMFDSNFVQQDVARESATQLKLNNVITMDRILRSNGKKLSLNKKIRLLGVTEADLEDTKEEYDNAAAEGIDNQLPKSEIEGSDDRRNIANRRRQEQQNIIQQRGTKPNGITQ